MEDITRHAKAIEASGLLDPDWYLDRHPDVQGLGLSAAEHYLLLGAHLLRDPGPRFSTGYYLATHKDVAASGMNPLLHYLYHGHVESRPCHGLSPFSAADAAQIREAFDAEHYASSLPDSVLPIPFDPLQHYLSVGWQQGGDPSPEFSTNYYLRRAPDVCRPGVNPFPHYVLKGRKERRHALPLRRRRARLDRLPRVSVIIPNYNHARFLRQRIESVLAQSYRNFDLLILDDCSTDNSREVIEEYCRRYPETVRCLYNERNAGNVFRQWRKGIEATTGELIWICESDDFCEPDFLDKLLPLFNDRSVNLAFGRIQFSDADGGPRPGLDAYREGAEAGIWGQTLVQPACRWFGRAFGVNNVIANVGGCVWRRQPIDARVWDEAGSYRILGDWFLYLHIAGTGQIGYEPAAVAHFRQHGENTSVTAFHTPGYYHEHERLMLEIKSFWPIPDDTVRAFHGKIAHQYAHFGVDRDHGPLDRHVDLPRLLAPGSIAPHILIAFLGFHSGGGEVFAIQLANALRRSDCRVSMLALDMLDINQQMLDALDASIPVYDADQAFETGADRFLRDAGISVIHTHMLSMDWFLLEFCRLTPPVPYLVTMHGSYEASSASDELLARMIPKVSHWVYTTPRNLERLSMANAMPDDAEPFPMTREDLGISEEAVVFAFVARGIPRKGWRAIIQAFVKLRARQPDAAIHLLLCGDGPETDRQRASAQGTPDMTFLGYQSRINGLYRLSDCAVIPTRYPGESFPLCLIQALQTGTPVVASAIGEIPNMVRAGTLSGGILIPALEDTEAFTDRLCDAMAEMLAPAVRERYASQAARLGEGYDMGALAERYRKLYRSLLRQAETGLRVAEPHQVAIAPG
jgi:glycosyltransferase involved in cell wall biosynthesis